MHTKFINELSQLKDKPSVSQNLYHQFLERINSNNLTKQENYEDHFCSFFVPIHKKSGSIYLGHHIKANDWIPPGGHIDGGEGPKEAVYREFGEELGYTLKKEQVVLFDLTTKDITNPKFTCRIHWDYWYVVFLENIFPFHFDKGEFYGAQWFSFQDALSKTKHMDYLSVLRKLADTYTSLV